MPFVYREASSGTAEEDLIHLDVWMADDQSSWDEIEDRGLTATSVRLKLSAERHSVWRSASGDEAVS